MRKKKNPKVDLENRKTSFFLAGLILAIGGTIAVINMKWSQKEIEIVYVDPNDEDVIEIMPTLTKVAPKVRKKLAVVSEVLLIKDIIEPTSEEPEIKLEEPKDVFEGIEDPDFDPEPIEFIPDDGPDEIIPFILVEKYPTFLDCGEMETKDDQKTCFEKGMLNHIASNFKYPHKELAMGLEEKVWVEFVISKKGEVGQVKIVRGNLDGFIKESKRLINSLPKVKPAEQRGKPVNMKYTIPIKFQIK